MPRLEEYANKYQDIRMQRRNGILEVTLHNKGNSLVWNESVHRELPYACADLGADPENKVVILTSVGDSFCAEIDFQSFGALGTSRGWDKIYWEGKRLLMNLLDIEAPVIAAVNGRTVRYCDRLRDSGLSRCATFSWRHRAWRWRASCVAIVAWRESRALFLAHWSENFRPRSAASRRGQRNITQR
jgi:hypothetical protein